MIPDFIKLENTIAKSHKNRIRNSKGVQPLTQKHTCCRLSQSWRLEKCCQTGSTQEGSQRNMRKRRGCAECVVTVSAVIGRAGSSWERPAGAVYGFHSDGLFLAPPSPNAYRGPSERGVQLGGGRQEMERGEEEHVFCVSNGWISFQECVNVKP